MYKFLLSIAIAFSCYLYSFSILAAGECEEHLDEYLSLWKEMAMERSNLTDDNFDKHIKVERYYMSDHKNVSKFNVQYQINKDYFHSFSMDDFIVKLHKGHGGFKHFGVTTTERCLPRNEITIIAYRFGRIIAKSDLASPLYWESEFAMKSDIVKELNIERFKPDYVQCEYRSAQFRRLTKKSSLTCSFRIDGSENRCIYVVAGLQDGKVEASEDVCIIYN